MIKTICVCGAGTMGSGIAQVIASNNIHVIQFDVNESMLEKSKTAIANNLQKLVDKGRLEQARRSDILQRITFTSSIKDCVGELIIEAVVEDKLIKQNLFDELATINTGATIFATNTSSISITALSKEKKYASRFAGLHFFNPAPLMKLVEIIRTEHTNDEVIDTLKKFTEQLGKTAVVCNDAPGFIVNRVARHYYLEAMQIAEKGIADIRTIDTIMEATGFKMGPFKLMDLIGLDVNYAVSNIVWNELGRPERLKPSRLQKDKVDANELGKKSGKGFYEY